MRNQFKHQNNTKLVIYTVILIILLGITGIILHDIQLPAEHTVHKIGVNLEK